MATCSVCMTTVLSVLESLRNLGNITIMGKVGLRCSKCGTVVCQSCSHDKAKAKGNSFFTCPGCGADVSNDQIR